jgi:drug/metabolite transporter (DMT)-like permease
MNKKLELNRIEFLLLSAVCIWGLNPTIVKLALNSMDNILYNILRTATAAVVCWLILLIMEKDWRIEKKDIAGILGTGFLGHFGYQFFYIYGIGATTAGNASIIFGSLPVFVVLINFAFKLEDVNILALFGIAISFTGMFVVVCGSGKSMSLGSDFLKGSLLIVFSTLCWAIYTISIKRYLKKYSSLKVTTYGISVSLISMAVFWFDHIDINTVMNLPGISVFSVLYSGILSFALASIFWSTGVVNVGSIRTSVYNNITPIISIICGIVVLGEKFGLMQGIGSMMILSGLRLTRIKDNKQAFSMEQLRRKAQKL